MMYFMMKMMPQGVKRTALSRHIRYTGTLRYLMMAAIMLTFLPTKISAAANESKLSTYKKMRGTKQSSFGGWGKISNFFLRSKTFYFALAVIVLLISASFLGVSNGDDYGASDLLRDAIRLGGGVFLGCASVVACYRFYHAYQLSPESTVADWHTARDALKGTRAEEKWIKHALNYGVPALMIILAAFLLVGAGTNGAIGAKSMVILPGLGLMAGGLSLIFCACTEKTLVSNFFDGTCASVEPEKDARMCKLMDSFGSAPKGAIRKGWESNWKSYLIVLTCIIALVVANNSSFGDDQLVKGCAGDIDGGSSMMFRMAIMIPASLLLMGTVGLQIYKINNGEYTRSADEYSSKYDGARHMMKSLFYFSLFIIGIGAMCCAAASGGGNDTAGLIILSCSLLSVGGYKCLQHWDLWTDVLNGVTPTCTKQTSEIPVDDAGITTSAESVLSEFTKQSPDPTANKKDSFSEDSERLMTKWTVRRLASLERMFENALYSEQ